MNKKKKNTKTNNNRTTNTVKSKTSTVRVLAHQPLSVKLAPQTLNEMKIQSINCRISIRSAHEEKDIQLKSGGSLLAIEFDDDRSADLIVTARKGLALLEDFLSALAVVTGSTFQTSELLQIVRLTKSEANEFIIFKNLPIKHWAKEISTDDVRKAQHLIAHWDGLESGNRLRRAALQYRGAIGTLDDAIAFQEAYIGLECMEPPLAKIIGLTPGTEEVKGQCVSCGFEFVRKKTALVGVRSFVLDDIEPNNAEEGRKSDWKLINKLRNDLMHGLVDPEKLADRPNKGLITCMHHLHSAICHASHSDELIEQSYRLARGGPTYIFCGSYKESLLSELGEWGYVIQLEDFTWVPHAEYGFVPQLQFRNSELLDFYMGIGVLAEPLSFATVNSISPVRYEHD
jgi:hypothetical protein